MGDTAMGADPAVEWVPVTTALVSYLQGVTSPATQASLTFFPASGVCGLDLDAGANGGCICQPTEYWPGQAAVNATVPLTQVLGNSQLFADLVNATTPSGGTPTIAGLQGSYDYAYAVQVAQPGSSTSVILITDGQPGFGAPSPDGGSMRVDGCTGNNLATVETLVQSYRDRGIDTYVFGIGSIPSLSNVAAAGGHSLITIPVGDPTATRQQLLTQLHAVW
jgi:hypothetical protein